MLRHAWGLVLLTGSKNEGKSICRNSGFQTMLAFSMCRTCLHWACKRNHAPVVAYLLHAGADKEILTKKGERPAQLTSKREIRKMLGGKPIGYAIFVICSKRQFMFQLVFQSLFCTWRSCIRVSVITVIWFLERSLRKKSKFKKRGLPTNPISSQPNFFSKHWEIRKTVVWKMPRLNQWQMQLPVFNRTRGENLSNLYEAFIWAFSRCSVELRHCAE